MKLQYSDHHVEQLTFIVDCLGGFSKTLVKSLRKLDLSSTLKEETFTFRGNKLSRMTSYEKFRAGINFRGQPLSKDFTGIKKGENINL